MQRQVAMVPAHQKNGLETGEAIDLFFDDCLVLRQDGNFRCACRSLISGALFFSDLTQSCVFSLGQIPHISTMIEISALRQRRLYGGQSGEGRRGTELPVCHRKIRAPIP